MFKFENPKFKSLIIIFAAIVVFTTTYSLILPAITIDKTEAETVPGIVLLEDDPDASLLEDAAEVVTVEDEAQPEEDMDEVQPEDLAEEDAAPDEEVCDSPDDQAVTPNERAEDHSEDAYDNVQPDASDEELAEDAEACDDSEQDGQITEDADTGDQEDEDIADNDANEEVKDEVDEDDSEDTSEEIAEDSLEEETAETEESEEETTADEVEMPAMVFEAEIKKSGSTEVVEGTEEKTLEEPGDLEEYLDGIVLKVTAEAEEGTFPAGTTMRVQEVTDDQEVIDTVADVVDGTVDKIQAVDITFYDADGVEIQPEKEIKVTISSGTIKEEKSDNDKEPVIVHIPEDGDAEVIDTIDKEKLETLPEDQDVIFETDRFSIYAFVYTVDFHWEVNGKMYEFSIPGGGFVSLQHLVEVLGIATDGENSENGAENAGNGAENADESQVEVLGAETEHVANGTGNADESQVEVPGVEESSEHGTAYEETIKLNEVEVSEAAKKFVTDVESVEFSSPELVWVGKVESDSTVAGLKEANRLEVDYSAALTEKQIAKINAQTVEAGDWALISVRPFTSEESLIVTMLNGDQWTVKVTDAVPGAFPQIVDIEIAGDGSITLSEYIERYDWDWMGDYAYEERQTFYSGRTVDLSVRYGSNVNNQSITANAAPGYVFDHWEKNGTPLTGGDLESEVIPAGALSFNPHDTLKAVFRPEPESGGGESYTDFDALTEAWKEKITNSKPDVDKTAAVYDYENRIYKVDITASSKLYGVIEDLDLAFVTDVSGSMHFPSKMESAATFNNEQGMLAQLDSLCRQRHGGSLPSYTGPDEIYYIITDPQNASNVYAIRRYNNLWYAFPAGVIDLSPIYAPVLDPNNRQWSRLDSCFDSGGNVLAPFTTPTNQIVEKNVYLATDTTQRLEYLREALRLTQSVIYKMDPDAKIGVTTFASTANRGRLYNNTAQDQNALRDFITNISVRGGTRQDLGLIEGKALLDTDTSDVKKTIVLITDGAPNGTSWGQIQYQANIIKNAGIDIYTVGLSLENVTGASEGLYNTSSNSIDEQHGFAFDARDGRGLVEAVKSILESLTVHATMVGSVTDTIDPAFYPVDKDGNPLSPGVEYEDENGHAYTLSKQGDAWTVTWSDQNIEWAQDGASETQVPGWKGTVYVKAKENFLGGNAIKTNGGTSADKIEITGYKTVIDTDEYDDPIYSDTHQLKNEDGTPMTVSETLSTPYVNVDELALTSNDTEWIVYLGTEVDPKDELEKLLKSIEIRKVVSDDTDEMITSADQMLGGTGASSKTMKLTDYLGLDSDSEISALVNELYANESITFPYDSDSMASVYGHGHVGDIVISLTDPAGCYNKGNHATENVGKDAEFTLKVEYQPGTNTERNNELNITDSDYHTMPDGSPGDPVPKTGNNMISSNHHVINVYVKGLQITKKDQPFTNKLEGAEFTLYRTARDGETEGLLEINGKQFFPVTILDMTTESVAEIEQIDALEEGEEYYLVETEAPNGYIKLEDPIPVYLEFTNTYIPKPGDTESSEKPDMAPYSWNQSAKLTLGSSPWVRRTDEAGTTDLTQTALSADTQGDTMYYDIANNVGAVLPNTGGPGTHFFTILGSMLFLGAGVLLWRRRKSI